MHTPVTGGFEPWLSCFRVRGLNNLALKGTVDIMALAMDGNEKLMCVLIAHDYLNLLLNKIVKQSAVH